MAVDQRDAVLPCGRDPLQVMDQARAGRIDEHSRSCRHCRSAIADDDRQLLFVEDLQSEPVDVPDTLLPSVMRTVWSELRPGRRVPLTVPEGTAFATELAITSMIQQALEQLPELVVHTCRLHFADDPVDVADAVVHESLSDATEDERTTGIRVEVRAAAGYPSELAALADTVRESVAATLLTQFGLSLAGIDVFFVDVYEMGDAPR